MALKYNPVPREQPADMQRRKKVLLLQMSRTRILIHTETSERPFLEAEVDKSSGLQQVHCLQDQKEAAIFQAASW